MRLRIACFAMGDHDHLRGLLLVIRELVRHGAAVRLWTDAAFRLETEAEGAEFANLFETCSLDEADHLSRPLPVRYVTFAALAGLEVTERVRAWKPDLIVYDSFALIGEIVARGLELPWVPVCPGHVVCGAPYRKRLDGDPRVAIDSRCWSAVARLSQKYGLAHPSPFSYVFDPSPWLNVALEPKEWLSTDEQKSLEPVVFFGSLSAERLAREPEPHPRNGHFIYAAFGTIIWRYWTAEATAALSVVAEAISMIEGAHLTIGLGGGELGFSGMRRITAHGATVLPFADQWAELQQSDLFITHQGTGSTHEAVAAMVPMLSLPFFWDQPALAARCEEFGLTDLLSAELGPRACLDVTIVRDKIIRAIDGHDSKRRRLREAREWEKLAVASRTFAVERIFSLLDRFGGPPNLEQANGRG